MHSQKLRLNRRANLGWNPRKSSLQLTLSPSNLI